MNKPIKVKLTRVVIKDVNKEGQPLFDKNGKKYWRVGIQADRFNGDWYTALAFRQEDKLMNLKAGQEIEIITEEANGFKNFKLPHRIDLLEERIKILEEAVRGLLPREKSPQEVDEGINVDDIPF